jgi:hypothetical protein
VSIPRRWAVILWVATAGLLMFSRLRASGQASSSLSDEEIFQLLVPDHKSKAEKAAAHPDEPAYSPYRLEVAERLETDFGIAGKHYSLVAVQEMTGFCGSCYPTYFGIIDRDSGNLAWSYLNIGLHGSPNLRTFPLSKGDRNLVFAIQRTEGSQGCCTLIREDWYRPRLSEEGFDCAPIWSGLIQWENAGNRSGTQEMGCGRMAREPGGPGFLYSTVTSLSLTEDISCDDSSEDLVTACAKSPQDLCGGAVELTTTERFEVTESGLKRTRREVARKDRVSSKVFPFRLPVRSGANFPSEPGAVRESRVDPLREVRSPDGKYRIETVRGVTGAQEVRLVRRADGETVRTVKMSDGDFFDGDLVAVGWMRDSSRFFAVVRFGYLGHEGLLSFAVSSGVDLWEKLLADDAARYSDGFVLTSRSRASPPPHR